VRLDRDENRHVDRPDRGHTPARRLDQLEQVANDKLFFLLAIRLAFVASAVLIAFVGRLSNQRPERDP
jgi:hypothetical protein